MVWATVIEAGHGLGRLDAIAKELLPDPTLVSRPTIRREAVSTSALEGTYAPAAEVLSPKSIGQPRSLAVVEVLNFISSDGAGDRNAPRPSGLCRFACELQDTLVRGTPSEDWRPARCAKQVIIGPYKGCSVLEAHFIPPPPGDQLREGLTGWERSESRDKRSASDCPDCACPLSI